MIKIWMIVALTSSSVIGLCSASAIPMWEYLSRDEKMSHLYSMFAKQVQQYCKSRADVSKPQCKRDLLMHGLGKLNGMDDTYIDNMDPYQRGASDLIWDSMMQGHPMKPYKKIQANTEPTDYQTTGNFVQNPIFANTQSSVDPMDEGFQDNTRQPHVTHLQAPTNVHLQYLQPPFVEEERFLTGPMVIRVHPDGSPVTEDKPKTYPTDDDRVEMTLGRDKLPTMEEVYSRYQENQNHYRTNQH